MVDNSAMEALKGLLGDNAEEKVNAVINSLAPKDTEAAEDKKISVPTQDSINNIMQIKSIIDEMENGEAIVENITSEKVTVAGYNGYRVYGYYKDDNEWLVEWFFEVGNDKIYYIALEGSDLLEEYFDIPDTFSLTKIE